MSMTYLRATMQQLSNILYNTSQSNSEYNSKDCILNTIKGMIQDYNDSVSVEYKVGYTDFRYLK